MAAQYYTRMAVDTSRLQKDLADMQRWMAQNPGVTITGGTSSMNILGTPTPVRITMGGAIRAEHGLYWDNYGARLHAVGPYGSLYVHTFKDEEWALVYPGGGMIYMYTEQEAAEEIWSFIQGVDSANIRW